MARYIICQHIIQVPILRHKRTFTIGSAFAITGTAPVSGDYAYLWLCSKDGNNYRFQNLKSGKYLGHKGANEDTPYNFLLNKDVTNTSCVTLYSVKSSKYNVIKHSENKFDQADGKFHNENFSSDFLFVPYAANTLSHNQYYYIYCDNDDSSTTGTDRPQYLYNGTSTTIPLQTDASQVSLTNYAWRANKIFDSENPSKDYFTFKNGSKFVAFHSLSDDAYSWQTNKNTSSIGTGRVMLWGSYKGGRYMAFNYGDTENSNSDGFSNADTGLPKSGQWSQDFMFVIAPQTNVYRVAIQVEGPSDADAVFTFDGIDYSGDCSIYVDGNNLPNTKNISLKSSNTEYTFKGFYLEDGTSLGTTIDISALAADKGVKAVFYPFKLSTDFANATWYYMQVKDKWATVDPYPESSGYLMYDTKQVSENALWAFVDFSGDGFYIVNYTKGSSKKLDFYTPATFETSNGYTKCYIKWEGGNVYIYNHASDGDWFLIANSVLLSTSTSAANGAISLETVDWGELAKVKIDEYYYSHAPGQYFGASTELTSSTKASITAMGAAFTKANYESMDLSALTKYPETGYYYVKSVGARNWGVSYITYSSAGLVTQTTSDMNSIIRLKKESSVYKLSVQGLNLQPFSTESQQAQVTAEEGCEVTLSSYSPGVGIIQNSIAGTPQFPGYSKYFHEDASSNVVSWEHTDNASHWTIEKVEDFDVTLNSGGDGNYYATFCAPFSFTISGATAYTLERNGDWLIPTAIDGAVPAGTPVLLRGTSGTATLTISGTDYAATPLTTTALTGTYLEKEIDGSTDYVLGINGGVVGFYHWNSNTLAANRAFLDIPAAGVKSFALMFDEEDATGIKTLDDVQGTTNDVIYNVAGQRMSRMQKGINIINGKKILK